jgi:ABC-type multidrug transport system fused ATPase/permease subunit
MYDIRAEIFVKLQRLDLRFYDRNPVGRLMTRITNDVETLNNLFSSGVVTVFGDLFTLFFIVAAMLKMNWRLALVSFAVLPLVFLAAFLFRAKIRSAYRDIHVRIARVNAVVHEHITGIRVVQLFNREKAEAKRLAELNDDHLQAHLRSIRYYALFFPVIQFFTSLALALILWYGGLRALDGALTVGVIAAFLQYARRFFRPIQDLSEKYNLLQAAMASSERVFKLLDEEIAITELARPRQLGARLHGRLGAHGGDLRPGAARGHRLRCLPGGADRRRDGCGGEARVPGYRARETRGHHPRRIRAGTHWPAGSGGGRHTQGRAELAGQVSGPRHGGLDPCVPEPPACAHFAASHRGAA